MSFEKGNIPWNKGKIGVQISTRKGIHTGQIAWNKQENYKSCEICNKQVRLPNNRLSTFRFCSKKCRNIWQSGMMKLNAPTKNKESALKLSNTKRGVPNFKIRGDKNGSWRGGVSFEPYSLGWTNTFKEQIRYRDGYKCQGCGKPEVEHNRRLSIHHIDFDKHNLSPDNLITLCNKCHGKANWNHDFKYIKIGVTH